MATHPVADKLSKEYIKNRILSMLVLRNVDLDTVSNEQFPADTSSDT